MPRLPRQVLPEGPLSTVSLDSHNVFELKTDDQREEFSLLLPTKTIWKLIVPMIASRGGLITLDGDPAGLDLRTVARRGAAALLRQHPHLNTIYLNPAYLCHKTIRTHLKTRNGPLYLVFADAARPTQMRCLPKAGPRLVLRFHGVKKLALPLSALSDHKNIMGLVLDNTGVSDGDLKEVARHKDLELLHLFGTSITDKGVKHLATLENLRALDLSWSKITKESLPLLLEHLHLERLRLGNTPLKRFPVARAIYPRDLWELDLEGTGITLKRAGFIARLRFLRFLNVAAITVSRQFWGQILRRNTLRRLTVKDLPLAKESWNLLSGVSHLEYLNLARAKPPEKFFVHLSANNKLRYLDLRKARISSRELIYLDKFKDLEALKLSHCYEADKSVICGLSSKSTVSDEVMRSVAKLRNLKLLDVGSSGITKMGVRHLFDLKSIKILDIMNTGLDAKSLVGIEKLQSLEYLDISNNRIKSGAHRLGALPQLRGLDISTCDLGAKDITFLGNLAHLVDLVIGYNHISDQGFAALNGLKHLRTLTVFSMKIGDVAIGHLRALVKLTNLGLYRTAVTKKSLPIFSALPWLRNLDLEKTPILCTEIATFSKKHPHLHISSSCD